MYFFFVTIFPVLPYLFDVYYSSIVGTLHVSVVRVLHLQYSSRTQTNAISSSAIVLEFPCSILMPLQKWIYKSAKLFDFL